MIAPEISEDEALSILSKPEITAAELASLARSSAAAKSRKVTTALVIHPRTPRHISIPMLRRMFTFDVMQLTLTASVAADIKRAGEDQLLLRMEALSSGEKISLARRASGRVSAALLQESDTRIIAPALDNSRLTEALVVQALMNQHAPAVLFELVAEHRNWSCRREVQLALLASENTPLIRARDFATNFSVDRLQEVVPASRRDTLLRGIYSAVSSPSARQDFESGGHK